MAPLRAALVALCSAAFASAGSSALESCSNDDGISQMQLRRSERADVLDSGFKFKKQVLLIIDMQNDYSVAYNMETYKYLRNPFLSPNSTPIELIAQQQVKVINAEKMDWDMIVFSQDWLIPSIIASIGPYPEPETDSKSFCIRDTPGAEPLQMLLDAAEARTKAKKIRFAKNQDNVFNTVTLNPDLGPDYQEKVKEDPSKWPAVPEDYPMRGYDSNNTYNNKTMQTVLSDMGYTPETTRLTIVGTITDMCVLTSTMNALNLGYEVQVYVPGLNGGSNESDAGWTACDHGKPGDLASACCVPLPEEIVTDPINTRGWRARIPPCQAAAGYNNALEYMKLAGAELLWRLPHCPWKAHS